MKELSYNFSIEVTKECFVMNGLDHVLMSGLMEMFELCKEDFAKEILASDKDKNEYQFILTIKGLD